MPLQSWAESLLGTPEPSLHGQRPQREGLIMAQHLWEAAFLGGSLGLRKKASWSLLFSFLPDFPRKPYSGQGRGSKTYNRVLKIPSPSAFCWGLNQAHMG